MIKQIEIHGQCFELYSPDDGRTWSSSPQIDRCLWAKEKDLALAATEKV
jgi:hypothetical protein